MRISKNAHWLFDRGLWSLTDDCRVVIATGKFFEAGLDAFLLARMAGKQVLLPKDKELWPEPIYVSWHRTNRFQGS
jgi:putative restriction endonuclease